MKNAGSGELGVTGARDSKRRLRVLLLSMEYPPQTGWGGIGSHVGVLAPALASRGHDVHVLSCVPGQPASDYCDRGVWVHRRRQLHWKGLGRLLFSPGTAVRVDTALSCYVECRRLDVHFDVVEAPSWMGEGFVFAALRSLPLVVYIVTSPGVVDAAMPQPRWDVRLADRFERFAIARAQVVTTPSMLSIRSLDADLSYNQDKVRIGRYAVDLERWAPATSAVGSKRVILFVGRLERRKAPEVLVDAMALLATELEGIEAMFVGRSNGREDGMDYGEWLAERARRVHAPCRFLGQVSPADLVEWYKVARVVAVPSRYESFSLVAAEAMAAGRPIVCTTTTGISELVNGSNAGKIIPPDDPAKLAAALRCYLVDRSEAERAGKTGRQLIEQNCAPATVAEQREGFYREAISRWESH